MRSIRWLVGGGLLQSPFAVFPASVSVSCVLRDKQCGKALWLQKALQGD
jgi:hypothetical protein